MRDVLNLHNVILLPVRAISIQSFLIPLLRCVSVRCSQRNISTKMSKSSTLTFAPISNDVYWRPSIGTWTCIFSHIYLLFYSSFSDLSLFYSFLRLYLDECTKFTDHTCLFSECVYLRCIRVLFQHLTRISIHFFFFLLFPKNCAKMTAVDGICGGIPGKKIGGRIARRSTCMRGRVCVDGEV